MPTNPPATAAASISIPIPVYKRLFLETCLQSSILKFGGPFTLKSGRHSPYFFNAGLFHTARLLHSLSTAFAHTIINHEPRLEFDVLFGPAYKGIPLATATIGQLSELDPRFENLSYSFNRKEAKDHGEGGVIVGGELKGKKVVIIDDVVTAGTAKREAIELIKKEGGQLVGIIVALDRMEKMPAAEGEVDDDGVPRPSAIGQIRKEYDVPVLSILTLDDLVGGLKDLGRLKDAQRCDEYRERYKASDSK